MYSVAICDDETEFLNATRSILCEIFSEIGEEVTIDCFDSLQKLDQSDNNYNLLLLDIMFGEDNGMEYAEALRSKGIETDIVFITSSPEYALAGYSVYPVDYILKPIKRSKLSDTIKRCLQKRERIPALLVSSKEYGRIRVNVDDITYCEVIRTNIVINCVNGKSITLVGTFSSFCENLPKREFYRCHRSYAVNMKYVERIDRYNYSLTSGIKVPIAKNNYNEAKKAFVDYVNPVEGLLI